MSLFSRYIGVAAFSEIYDDFREYAGLVYNSLRLKSDCRDYAKRITNTYDYKKWRRRSVGRFYSCTRRIKNYPGAAPETKTDIRGQGTTRVENCSRFNPTAACKRCECPLYHTNVKYFELLHEYKTTRDKRNMFWHTRMRERME